MSETMEAGPVTAYARTRELTEAARAGSGGGRGGWASS